MFSACQNTVNILYVALKTNYEGEFKKNDRNNRKSVHYGHVVLKGSTLFIHKCYSKVNMIFRARHTLAHQNKNMLSFTWIHARSEYYILIKKVSCLCKCIPLMKRKHAKNVQITPSILLFFFLGQNWINNNNRKCNSTSFVSCKCVWLWIQNQFDNFQ